MLSEEQQEIVAQLNGQTSFREAILYFQFPLKVKVAAASSLTALMARSKAKETKSNLAVEVPEPEQSLEEVVDKSRKEMEELSRIIMQITSAYKCAINLQMEVVPQGLRILIQDDKQRDMFNAATQY